MTKPTVFNYKDYEDLLEENARLKDKIMELVEINEDLKKTLFGLVGDENEDDNT